MSGITVSPESSSDDRIWAALAYPFAPLAIFLLLVDEKKKRPFIKYHAIQALALSIPIYVISIPLVFSLVGACAIGLLWAATFYPAWKAFGGNYTQIPVLTSTLKNQGIL